MYAGLHLPVTGRKLLTCGTAFLCLISLISMTTGAMHPLPPSKRAQSATVGFAGHNSSPCFENLDLQFEVSPANAQAFHVIANPHRPKAVVDFIVETPVESGRHNRPPPNA